MHVQPKVFLINKPQIDYDEIGAFLDEIDSTFNFDVDSTAAEDITEAAGRICYRSWEPRLNPNVTRVRESREYMDNIISSRHGSVMEHAQFSFIFHNVSRVFTHELIRHRTGTAVSQESLRFVRINSIPLWQPEWALEDVSLQQQIALHLFQAENLQLWLADHFRLDDPGTPFSDKKKYTSYMRRFAPEGIGTSLVWSCNVRELRHVIEARTSVHAEEEIRLVFDAVAHLMVEESPKLFSDFTRHDDGSWVPTYSKI